MIIRSETQPQKKYFMFLMCLIFLCSRMKILRKLREEYHKYSVFWGRRTSPHITILYWPFPMSLYSASVAEKNIFLYYKYKSITNYSHGSVCSMSNKNISHFLSSLKRETKKKDLWMLPHGGLIREDCPRKPNKVWEKITGCLCL